MNVISVPAAAATVDRSTNPNDHPYARSLSATNSNGDGLGPSSLLHPSPDPLGPLLHLSTPTSDHGVWIGATRRSRLEGSAFASPTLAFLACPRPYSPLEVRAYV